MKIYINTEPTSDQIQIILTFILTIKDATVIIELLNFLFDITSNPNVLDFLLSLNAVDSLVYLLSNDNENVCKLFYLYINLYYIVKISMLTYC